MKFNKYAGIGMTCLLVLGDAYADTIIASKAYVDSKVSSVDVSGAVATGSNALTIADSTTTAPSVTAVKGAASTTVPVSVSNGAASITAGDNTHFITSGAVSTAFDRLDKSTYATDEAGTKPVTSVTQSNGLITVTRGTITDAGLAASAVTTAKLAADAVTSAKVLDKSLQYQFDMNNTALYEINTGAAPTGENCTKSIPCMLTYYKDGGRVYTRWTPLEIDGLSSSISSVQTDAGATI